MDQQGKGVPPAQPPTGGPKRQKPWLGGVLYQGLRVRQLHTGLGAGPHKAWESHQLLTGQDTLHRLATPRVPAGPLGRDRAAGIWKGTQSLGGGVGAAPGPLPIRAETPPQRLSHAGSTADIVTCRPARGSLPGPASPQGGKPGSTLGGAASTAARPTWPGPLLPLQRALLRGTQC